MSECRKVQVKRNGVWEDIKFEELNKGELFRMFEPDNNEPVKDEKGNTEFTATSEPYITKENVWAIDVLKE